MRGRVQEEPFTKGVLSFFGPSLRDECFGVF